jgi:hypothetical protein
MNMQKTPKGDSADNDMQAVGHQIGSLASVLVVAAVQFGIPLTPGQQSSILSVIAVAWAFFATIYGIRHRIPRRTRNTPSAQTQPSTTPPRAPRSTNATSNINGSHRRRATDSKNGATSQHEMDKTQ